MQRRVGIWAMGAFLAAAALVALSSVETGAPVVRGASAPAFDLPRLPDGGRVSLSDLEGRVVLINFWATWCKPCEDEMPAMERLYRALQSDGFELVAISVDEDRDAVVDFQQRLGLSFPILLDPQQRVAHAYQAFRFPESLLVGPDGIVVERYVGAKEWDAEAYVDRVRRLLASAVPSAAAARGGS